MTSFNGRLLRVDLNHLKYRTEEIPVSYLQQYLSARGLSARYLFDEIPAQLDPLDPANKLILSIGALADTGLQGFSKWCAAAKSPLTGTIFRSISGGNFGVWLKRAGYDLLIIEGRAEKFSYLYLDKDGVHFMDAEELRGTDPRRLQIILKKKHGANTQSAGIGSAGEKLLRYAVITAGERTASRGGMGTIMGAKNLKAVCINVPAHKPEPADQSALENLAAKQVQILKQHPRYRNMNTLGTPYITTVAHDLGILPVRNFQKGRLADIRELNGEEFLKLKKAKAGCYHCMTRCGGMRDVTDGPFQGTQIDGPEYESIFAFGPLLGITDRAFVINANALCDYYGIDTISTGVSIAFAFELFEKGLLTPADTDGLELSWGRKESVFALLHKIGNREGIGYLLGEGVKRASQKLGEQTAPYAMHIKGLELPGYDPRGVKGYALSMATSNIGGSHMYGRPRDELSGKTDPYAENGKGGAIAGVQKEQALEDSLIACTFGNTGLDFSFYAQALLAATGIRELGDRNELLRIGERIVLIERCFNVREGFSRRDDCLPERLTSEPLADAGPATGQAVRHLDRLLDEYYQALGYAKNGIPHAEKLKELGLAGVVPFIKENL
jgi:aldehyde:ferredoxin oxidoreductase